MENKILEGKYYSDDNDILTDNGWKNIKEELRDFDSMRENVEKIRITIEILELREGNENN